MAIRNLLLCLSLSLLFACSNQPEAEQASNTQAGQKPNIILILADDMGYGDPGFNGGGIIRTPVLDRLAQGGMVFTQHYSDNTVCAPSRSVLMTGLHTGHTPIRGNKEVMPIGQHPLPDSVITIGEILQDAGYTTGAF